VEGGRTRRVKPVPTREIEHGEELVQRDNADFRQELLECLLEVTQAS
jgi:hypothetical protein